MNNLCFLVFSSLCRRSIYQLHSPTLPQCPVHACTLRYTPLWLVRLPRQNDKNLVLSFVIYYCRWSHHFMTSSSLVLLPLRVFICSDLSHCLSFLPSPPLCMFMFIQTHLSLFQSISPPFFSPPPYPCVQLLLPASFP